MSRQANMSDQAYQGYVAQIQTMGYDVSKLVRIPHQLKK
jgi:lipocalin